MKLFKYISIIIAVMLILVACTPITKNKVEDLNKQIGNLKEENQNLKKHIESLQKDIPTLTDQQQESLDILNCLQNIYDCTPISYSHRFIKEDTELRALPDSRLTPLDTIKKGTYLEILAAADIPVGNKLTRWLIIHTYYGDAPSANLGWIKESATTALTTQNQKLVTYPLRIKPGTINLDNQRKISNIDLNNDYWLDSYEGDNAHIYGGGGLNFTIPRDRIIYPDVPTEIK